MKRIIAVTLTLALCFSLSTLLVSCGGGDNQSASDSGDRVYVLRLDHSDPEGNATSAGFRSWAQMLSEASNGRLQIEIFYSSTLGPPREVYTNVIAGVSDIAWIATAILPGTFPLYEGGILPMLGAVNNISAALSFQQLLQENAELQAEFEPVRVLSMMSNELFIPVSNGPDVSQLSNWNGLRVRSSGAVQARFVENMGGSAMTIPVAEVFEAYNRRILDSAFWNWTGLVNFGLLDDTRYVVPNVIGFAPMVIVMNKDSYANLPDDLKAILDAHTGEFLAEHISTYWYNGAVASAGIVADAGVEIKDAEPALIAAWQAAAVELEADYIADMAARGMDGAAFLSRLRELMAQNNQRFPNNAYEEFLANR